MWPFKSKQDSEDDRLRLAEFRCWNDGAYPYDSLMECERCITDHAVRGCGLPEHNGFVAIAHDAGLHIHPFLINQKAKVVVTPQMRIEAGKFLLDRRAEILQLRELYSSHYKQPKPVQESQPQAQEQAID